MSAVDWDISPRQPSLWRARAYSSAALAQLQEALEAGFAHAGVPLVTAVAGGSLGRLEASPVSDVDLIVFVDDGAPGCDERIPGLERAFRGAGLRAPKPDGIYARPIGIGAILDPAARGSLTETPQLFGSRIQVLLDGRPVCRPLQFTELREAILRWYANGTGAPGWTHLMNDLSRYLHAYAGWQQFKYTRSDDDGWLLRQAKLRSSRIVTFAGLLFLLAEHGRQARADVTWLLAHLDKTPIERVLYVMAQYDDVDATQVLADYAGVHARLADPDIRRELIVASPRTAGEPVQCDAYTEIHALGDSMMTALTRFALARQHDWPLKIFRNWLF
mgnify:FL=1|tara:strand:- start:2731 stop:3726 length:996 start_codon:yes stop_codon:yes gene_type:complete